MYIVQTVLDLNLKSSHLIMIVIHLISRIFFLTHPGWAVRHGSLASVPAIFSRHFAHSVLFLFGVPVLKVPGGYPIEKSGAIFRQSVGICGAIYGCFRKKWCYPPNNPK